MRRVISRLPLALLLLAAPLTAIGQLTVQPSAGPGQPPPRKTTQRVLAGQEKLRYIVSQLELSAEESKHVEGLFTRFDSDIKQEQEAVQRRVEEIKALYAELQAAEQAGDQQKKNQINEQLRLMAPGARAEEEFLRDLVSALTPAQRATYEQTVARLLRAPDGALRPVDIVRIARGLNLTPEQAKALETTKETFRRTVNEVAALEDPQRAEMLQRFSNDIRAALTAEQQAAYDKAVTRMRPPAPTITGTLPGGGTVSITPVAAPPFAAPPIPGKSPAPAPAQTPTPTTAPATMPTKL